MAAPRKPQDHKTKQADPAPDEPFEFEHGGQTFSLSAPSEVLTAGFARKNRHRDSTDQLFTMLEVLADEAALDAIDDMKRDEFAAFTGAFYEHAGIELGE